MTGLGVIEGDDTTGLFQPTGTYTREAAAKVLTYMLLGPTAAEQLTATTDPFTDVSAESWSAPYIAYLANEHIIEGYGDGTFGPKKELSKAAWLKMLLCAMGYDADTNGMGDDANWATKAQALAAKSGLISGKDLGLDWNRETAVYYAFKAVEKNYNLADSKDKTKPFLVNVDSDNDSTNATTDKKTEDVVDEYGRPAYYYATTGSKRSEAYAKGTADADLVIENEVVENADLIKALGLTTEEAKNATFTIYVDGAKTETSEKSLVSEGTFVTSAGHYGSTVEFYKTSKAGQTPAYTVVEIDTHVAKIGEIAKNDTEVTLETISEQDVNVAVGDLKKDDIVSYNIGVDPDTRKYTAYNVTVLEGTQGKVTAVSAAKKYVRVDGVETYLSLNASNKGTEFSDVTTLNGVSATFYYDDFGNILYVANPVVPETTVDGYVYVLSKKVTPDTTTAFGGQSAAAQVQILDLTTGETSVVNEAIVKSDGKWYVANADGTANTEAKEIKGTGGDASVADTENGYAGKDAGYYGYYKQEDGTYVLVDLDSNYAAASAEQGAVSKNGATLPVNGKFADSNTVLTWLAEEPAASGTYKVTTATGIANFSDIQSIPSGQVLVTYAKDSNKAAQVIVVGGSAKDEEATSVNYAMYLRTGEVDTTLVSDKQTTELVFLINGEETTVKVLSNKVETLGLDNYRVYDLVLKADGTVDADKTDTATKKLSATVSAKTVDAKTDSYIYADSKQLNITSDTQIVIGTADEKAALEEGATVTVYATEKNDSYTADYIVVTAAKKEA
jgi:hypothetical protein